MATAGVPLLHAGAMAAGAATALVTGEGYDRSVARVLLALPFLVAALPLLAFGDSLGTVVAGTQVVAAPLLLSVVPG